jgi:hypothetical protein
MSTPHTISAYGSYLRMFFGFALAFAACAGFAKECGVVPDLSRLNYMTVFPGLGVVWGLLIAGQKSSSAQRLEQAGRGALYCGVLGAVGFAVEVFTHLDAPDALSAGMSNLGGTLFWGLFAWSLCVAATLTKRPPSTSAAGPTSIGSFLAEPWWYLGYSVCVVGCMSIVFWSLGLS